MSGPFYNAGKEDALPRTSKRYIAPVDEKAIGTRIRELRKRPDTSQAELAVELGVNQSAVSDYERGVVRVHPAMLMAVCQALKVSADELLELAKGKYDGRFSDRLLRRIEKLHQLSRRDQHTLLGTIDALLSKVS